MRYSKSILLLLVLALFVLTACTTGTQTTSTPFIGGTKALDISFVNGAPPKEIFDNKQGSFSVIVQLKNSGEANIDASDGYVQLEGIAPQEFGVTSAEFKQTMPAMRGARKTGSNTVVVGDQQQVTFGPFTYQRNINGNIASNKIIATACYNYMTKSSSDVCVKKDGVDDPSKKTSVCTIEGTKTVASSGGPVQITAATQTPLGAGKVQVQFTVGSVGAASTDLFFKKDTDCIDSQTNTDKYKVYVDVRPIVNDLYSAQCTGFDSGNSNAGYLTLFDGASRQFQCTFNMGTVDSDYSTPVNVELSYRYMQQIQTPLLIKDSGVGNTDSTN